MGDLADMYAKKDWQTDAVTADDTGDNELVATPGAGKYLVVKHVFVQNQSGSSGSVILKSGSTAISPSIVLADSASLNIGRGYADLIECGVNEALNLNASIDGDFRCEVLYYEEAVLT